MRHASTQAVSTLNEPSVDKLFPGVDGFDRTAALTPFAALESLLSCDCPAELDSE